MKTLLIYLLQVIVTSGILYGYYHFALRNKRFHRYNRFYLLAATILSIAIPFLNIPVYFTQTATESSFVLETLTVISSAGIDNSIVFSRPETHSNWFTWENLSLLFYILVACLVLFRIIFSLLKIRRIVRNNSTEQLGKIHFINTDEPGTPFSFFRWLFWNKKIELHSEKGEQIFRHELFHIEQKHSWDTIYMELLTLVFWINPFYYLIRKELKAIHEFLADQFAVSENTKWQYAELLLMQALNTNQHLVNPFFHNQIKRRITMITTSKKPSHRYARKLMVLPLTAIVLALFAFKYKERQADKENQLSEMIQVISDTIPRTADNKIFDRVEVEPAFPGGNATWKKYLERNLDASIPAKNKAPDGVYTVIVQFIVDKEGYISDVRSLTKHGYGMEEEAKRVIKAGPSWIPAVQNERIVKAYRKQPVTFVVNKEDKGLSENTKADNKFNEVVVVGYSTKNDNDAKSTVSDVKETTVQGYQTKKDLKEVTVEDYQTKKDLKEVVVTGYHIKSDNTVPTFPGGKEAWQRYLMVSANASVAVDSGAPAGIYKTIVRFIVHTDGTLTDIKAITNNGYGTEKEALRIISKGPKWLPATKNGKAINAYVEQPITFQVEEEIENSPVVLTQKTTNNNEKAVDKTVNIYPNPVSNIVTIPLSSQIAGTALIQIVDQAGNISLTQRPALSKGVNSITINASTLKPGAYIINLNHPDGTKRSYKMIKE